MGLLRGHHYQHHRPHQSVDLSINCKTDEVVFEYNPNDDMYDRMMRHFDWNTKMPSNKRATMLRSLRDTCKDCVMCPLGRDFHVHHHEKIDPHVFSNMNIAKVMVIGQNPGFNECKQDEPFVGEAGENFNKEVEKHGLSRNDFYITNICKCLRYNTKILLEDGTFTNISKLVRDRYDGKVMSMNDDGVVEPQKVVGWYKSELGSRRLAKLTYRLARKNAIGKHGPTLTEDHAILTDSGYKQLRLIDRSDRIATNEFAPNKPLEHVIFGKLLGDGFIAKNLAVLEAGHSIKQRDYVAHTQKLVGGTLYEYVVSDGCGKRHKAIRLRTQPSLYYKELRTKFYGDAGKTVEFLESTDLSNITLAYWYMDDGSLGTMRGRRPYALLSTNGFAKHSVCYLSNLLKGIGIDNTVVKSHGWRIRIGSKSAPLFFNKIAQYIHPTMRYKLPPEFKDCKFNDLIDECDTTVYWAKHPEIEYRSYRDKSVYCIDVENNHNFITTGGVVLHNCHTPENRKPTTEEIKRCFPFLLMEMAIIMPKLVVTLGAASFGTLCDKTAYKDGLGKFSNSSKLDTNVFAIYHPSPRNLASRRPQFERQIELLCGIIKHTIKNNV